MERVSEISCWWGKSVSCLGLMISRIDSMSIVNENAHIDKSKCFQNIVKNTIHVGK